MIATLLAAWAFSGAASAQDRRGCNCGPTAPTAFYKTVHPAKFSTRYHDVAVYRKVHRVHLVTNVTRVQPIVHIHIVTRVHHHTVVETSNAYRNVTQRLAPIRYVTRSIENYYDCHCGR